MTGPKSQFDLNQFNPITSGSKIFTSGIVVERGNNMKIGDPILVNVDPTLGDGQNWRRGTFISQRRIECPGSVTDGDTVCMVGIGEKHYFNYEEKEVYPHSVKRFIPLAEEEARAKHTQELPLVFAMVQAALAELLPGVTAELKESRLDIGSISCFGITLDPVVYETPRIGAMQETAGWQVTDWKYYHATRHQPEEWVDSPVGEPTHYVPAVQRFIEAIFKAKANSYWEHLADDAAAQSWAENEM